MATVAMVEPSAMPGRYLAWAASLPEWIRALAPSTTVEKKGAHSSALPISSRTMPSSTLVKPWPPCSSGTMRLCRPSWLAIWLQTAGS